MKNEIMAFPMGWARNSEDSGYKQEGMTLRDYFAGQALLGLFSDTEEHSNCRENAVFCYKQADAMLKEREKING